MKSNVFSRELKKQLKKRFTGNGGYEWSRRIYGAMVCSEDTDTIKEILFVVDSEVSNDNAKMIIEEICKGLKSDSDLRTSKLSVIFWKKDGFEDSFYRQHRYMRREYFVKYLTEEVFSYKTENSCGWNEFIERYNRLKKLEQVFLITTEEKVNSLTESKICAGRNTMIFYPTKEELLRPKVLRNFLCFGVLEKQTMI